MKYVSTRGRAPMLAFDDVLLAGLAVDGGLYVPEAWPDLRDVHDRAGGRSYAETAVAVMAPFVAGAIEPPDLASMVAEAYRSFDTEEVTPVVDLGDGLHLLELFHGPTYAFKDVALQLVGRLFEHVLGQRGERVTIVAATSGDTGSAAIEACRDRDAVDIVVLHPHGRVSEVQRRQMTTVDSGNVHNVAVEGTFDDCQDLVKAMFGDESLRADLRLAAVNSINWARVMAQVVYYVVASARVGRGKPVSFSVPTGNFGNIFAGHVARTAGVPIRRLLCASNRNDILTRLFRTGVMEIESVVPTISPSMDIQVSSNLERLLFELFDRDGAAVEELMTSFRAVGRVEVPPDRLDPVGEVFAAARFDDEETRATIRDVHERTGRLVDPHTAVGIAAARALRAGATEPMICLATAHPAKFPEAIVEATGVRPPVPDRLARQAELDERCTVLPNDLAAVSAHVRSVSRVPKR